MTDTQKIVRVFHPTLNSFEDVPAGDVDSWVEAGWRKSAPKHVNAEAFPPVGEHPGIARVPVLEDVSRTTSPSASSRGSSSRGSSSSTASTTSGTTAATS